jgi:hypothetical protein
MWEPSGFSALHTTPVGWLAAAAGPPSTTGGVPAHPANAMVSVTPLAHDILFTRFPFMYHRADRAQ